MTVPGRSLAKQGLVRSIVAGFKQWLDKSSMTDGAAPLFEVTCTCGATARGRRQPSHQILACRLCGRSLFVLPASPLPLVSGPGQPVSILPGTRWPRVPSRSLIAIVLVALLTLPGVAALLIWALVNRHSSSTTRSGQQTDLMEQVANAREELSQGHYWLATDLATTARKQLEREPATLPATERRQLLQLHREASILADVLELKPTQLLERAGAAGPAEQDWQTHFRQRFAGRSLIFAADVVRHGDRLTLGERIRSGSREAWVELGDVTLFQQLQGRRELTFHVKRPMIFGVRLAGLRLEPPGEFWAFRFEPSSGVLLTNPGAASALFGRALEPTERELLAEQTGWIADLP